MKPEELADELDRLLNGPRWSVVDVGVFVHDNRQTILSALCRVAELEAALGKIENYVLTVAYPSPSTVAQTARQALTGEA